MTIRRRCTERNCKDGRRCLEHLRFDVMWRGKRYRMPANEFAIPRKEPGRQRAIQSMEEARDWERLFIGEIKAGRDPQRPPSRSIHVSTEIGDVSAFLDAYLERCVRPAALRSFRSVCSQAATLKEHLGHLPLSALEEPDEINRFKTNSDYAEDVEVASVHRVLETLRAAMNWGMAQTPPLFAKSPFHRFGVRLNKKAETVRDRRLSRDEEKRLLDTALQQMNTGTHQYVGELLHDRIIGALELVLPARRDAADPEQTRELGHLPDRHPRGDGQRQREPSHSLQPPRTGGGDPEASRHARTRCVRLRQHHRGLPADDSDGLGNSAATRQRYRAARTERTERNGTESSCNESTCGGTTSGTKAPVGCWPTASTFGSSS